MVEAWLRRWDLSQKGRHTYAFFPNVCSRLIAQWFVATHYITQMVTGHGAFQKRLHRLGLAEDPRCGCPLGGPETPDHILYECTKYTCVRNRLRERALIEGAIQTPLGRGEVGSSKTKKYTKVFFKKSLSSRMSPAARILPCFGIWSYLIKVCL